MMVGAMRLVLSKILHRKLDPHATDNPRSSHKLRKLARKQHKRPDTEQENPANTDRY